jgi:hypothetical protein
MIRIETVTSIPREEHSMLRVLLIGLAFSAALATATFAQGKFGTITEAKGSAMATEAASKLGKNQKLCRSRKPDGSVKTWTCGISQPCCVNHTFNLYTCGSQLLQCL